MKTPKKKRHTANNIFALLLSSTLILSSSRVFAQNLDLTNPKSENTVNTINALHIIDNSGKSSTSSEDSNSALTTPEPTLTVTESPEPSASNTVEPSNEATRPEANQPNTDINPNTNPISNNFPNFNGSEVQAVGNVQLAFADEPIPSGKVGEKIHLKLHLVNYGTERARNIIIRPVLDREKLNKEKTEWPFKIQRTDYSIKVRGELMPTENINQALLVDFGELTLTRDIQVNQYPLFFDIRYQSENGIFYKIERAFYFDVKENPEITPSIDPQASVTPEEAFIGGGGGSFSEDMATPRLLLESFNTIPEKVLAGKAFNLKIKVKNTSSESDIENIKITFSNGDNAFLPTNGSSVLFEEKIAKNESKELSINLKPLATLEQKPLPLIIDFEYQDKNFTTLKSNESIAIVVNQVQRCEVGMIELVPDEIQVENSAMLSFPVYNKGKSTLYNVTAKFPENNFYTAQEIYLGNLSSGDSKDVETLIKTLKISPIGQEFEGLIEYEDEQGNPSQVKYKIPLSIIEKVEEKPELPLDELPTEAERASTASNLFQICIPLIIIMIIAFVIYKRRKAKKQKALELEQEALNALENEDNDEL